MTEAPSEDAVLRGAARLVSRLRFRHLQLLVELDRGGSLRTASQALNLTQPALSKALAEIESAFGLALFTRSARGLRPTHHGAIVIRGAALLLTELAHVQREAAAGDATAAIVRIGAPPFVAQGFLPQVLARLTRGDPPVRVELLEERVPLLMDALASGKVDALITSYPFQLPEQGIARFSFQNLFEAEFVVIAPPAHPLARSRRVSWRQLAAEHWVMPAPTSLLRRVLDEQFLHAGTPPPLPLVESTSPVTNVQMVAAGVGISAAPAPAARSALSLGQVRRLRVQPPLAGGPVALVCRRGEDNSRLDLLRDALGDSPELAGAPAGPAPGGPRPTRKSARG